MAVIERIREIFLPADYDEVEVPLPAAPTVYEIRPLTEGNLDEVLRLNLRCFEYGENYSKETFTHLLTAPEVLSYRIVAASGHMAGFVFVVAHTRLVGHITTIGIAPEHRERGLAKRLLQFVERAMKQKGFDSIVLEVRAGNHIAQNLYHRLGFTIIQKLDKYYSDGENAYLMCKAIEV